MDDQGEGIRFVGHMCLTTFSYNNSNNYDESLLNGFELGTSRAQHQDKSAV